MSFASYFLPSWKIQTMHSSRPYIASPIAPFSFGSLSILRYRIALAKTIVYINDRAFSGKLNYLRSMQRIVDRLRLQRQVVSPRSPRFFSGQLTKAS